MKQERPRFTRAALLCAAALLAAPVAAQTPPAAPPAPPPTAAPALPPAPAPVAPPPRVVPTIERDTTSNVTGGAVSTSPVNPDAAAEAAAEEVSRRAEARTVRRPAAQPVARAAPRPAPVAAPAPEPVAAPAAPAATPAPTVSPAPAEPVAIEEVPADNAVVTETETTTTESGGLPVGWIALGALLLAGLVGFLLWRRRSGDTEEYYETVYADPEPVAPAYVEPEPVIRSETVAPVVAAPIAAAAITDPVDVAPATPEDATVAEAEAGDVAALTAGTPAGDRPWLELAMRPIRAGTNVDEALVEIELTVGNAGSVQAEDVRISTFMLPAGSDMEMDRLLSQSRVDAAVEPLTLAPGEGTRVDATLALPRADLMANDATTFQPVVVADARYRLPDGSEGRTSASFVVGVVSDGDLGLFELDRPIMREDVEARLYRDPARV